LNPFYPNQALPAREPTRNDPREQVRMRAETPISQGKEKHTKKTSKKTNKKNNPSTT
jgi:hypothetical protein